ncbi:MAG: response regulator, partial [Clostridia bacterium]|nr:response regulator [Clostridia bacterium]
MKILFAAPDRDLLECFKQLLAGEFGETVTAFDGTQVLTLLSAENFDAVILDRALPRVDHKTLVARIREKDLPSVVLTDEPVSA